MKINKPLIGVHLSISGGFEKLFYTAEDLKINVFQFFLGSPVIWKNIQIKDEDIDLFKRYAQKFRFITAHAPYLVNLATSDKDLRKKSLERVISDLKELVKISVYNYVIHMGSNENIIEGIKSIKSSLKEVFSIFPDAKIILENSAGRKNDIGKDIKEIRDVLLGFEEKVGICIDTCHLFAGGINLRLEGEIDKFYEALKDRNLDKRVVLLHVNDSKYPCNSKKDRHWHIGKGEIGTQGFSNLIKHGFFSSLPLILETPKENDMDKANIRNLKKFFREVRQ